MLAAVLIAIGAVGAPGPDCWSLDLQTNDPLCRSLAAMGRVRHGTKAGPVVNGRPTVEARFEPTYGTGMLNERVALFQEVDGIWRVIWDHLAVEGNYVEKPWTETRFKWRYLGGANRIRITGVAMTGAKSTSLPVEEVCFRADLHRFEPC